MWDGGLLLDVTGAREDLQCLLILNDWIGVFVVFAPCLPGANCGNDNNSRLLPCDTHEILI